MCVVQLFPTSNTGNVIMFGTCFGPHEEKTTYKSYYHAPHLHLNYIFIFCDKIVHVLNIFSLSVFTCKTCHVLGCQPVAMQSLGCSGWKQGKTNETNTHSLSSMNFNSFCTLFAHWYWISIALSVVYRSVCFRMCVCVVCGLAGVLFIDVLH